MSQYVKFSYECARAQIAAFDQLAELNECRRKLRELHMIGVDSNGIGFGNLSVRDGATSNFYVTGSATGGLPKLALTAAYGTAGNGVRNHAPVQREQGPRYSMRMLRAITPNRYRWSSDLSRFVA